MRIVARRSARKVSVLEQTPPVVGTESSQTPEFRFLSNTQRIQTAETTVDDWIALPNHPHQRNTLRHANATHLKFAKRADGAVADHLRAFAGPPALLELGLLQPRPDLRLLTRLTGVSCRTSQ